MGNMKAITSEQLAVLEWIKRFIANNQYPPTRGQISIGCGLSGRSHAQHFVRRLEKAGCIECDRGVVRGIRVINPRPSPLPKRERGAWNRKE